MNGAWMTGFMLVALTGAAHFFAACSSDVPESTESESASRQAKGVVENTPEPVDSVPSSPEGDNAPGATPRSAPEPSHDLLRMVSDSAQPQMQLGFEFRENFDFLFSLPLLTHSGMAHDGFFQYPHE